MKKSRYGSKHETAPFDMAAEGVMKPFARMVAAGDRVSRGIVMRTSPTLILLVTIMLSTPTHAGVFHEVDKDHVEFDDRPLTIRFDRNFGGAPLRVEIQGQLFSHEHAGAGFQSVFETRGNDPTAASYDGISAFPVAKLNDLADSDRVYYARETKLTDTEYEVVGFLPFFLATPPDTSEAPCSPSGDPTSDHLPTVGTADQWSGKWCKLGTPMFFQSGAGGNMGVSMIGNHDRFRSKGEPWAGEIPEGRVAFSTVISLQEAAETSFAGVVYRRQLPDPYRNPTIDDVYAAPGYSLFVNKNGTLHVWASDKATPLFDTDAPDLWWLKQWIKAQLNTPGVDGVAGVHVEIRTHNWAPGIQELWLKDNVIPDSRPFQVASYTHDSTINTGPHLGFFAYCPGGRIGFYHRRVHDVGVEAVNTYRANPDGGLDYELILRPAPGIDDAFRLYSATQQFFALPANVGGKVGGVHSTLHNWQYPQSPKLFSGGKPTELFIGARNGNMRGEGLLCRAISATIDGLDESEAYASLQYDTEKRTEERLAIIHANVLPESTWHGPSMEVTSVGLRMLWRYFPGDEAPAVKSFTVNNQAGSTTNRTVILSHTASGSPRYYMASESLSFSGATWLPYVTAPSFFLSSGRGEKRVFFKVKNDAGESAVLSDTITLITPTRPSGISFGINTR